MSLILPGRIPDTRSLLAAGTSASRSLANPHSPAHIWDAELNGYTDHFPSLLSAAGYKIDFSGLTNQSGWTSSVRLDLGTGQQIFGGAAQAATQGVNTGSTGYYGSYNTSLATDNVVISAQLQATMFGNANNNNTLVSARIDNNWPSTGATMVCFAAGTGSGSQIFSFSGQTGTAQGNAGGNVTSTGSIQLYCIGRTYLGYISGVLTCVWIDSAGVIPTGSTRRRFGIGMGANYPIFQQEYASPAVTWFSGRDL